VPVAALALDGLGDEAGDVVAVGGERARACASARSSASRTCPRCSASGNRIAGESIRGQSKVGNRAVFTGSVLVSESV